MENIKDKKSDRDLLVEKLLAEKQETLNLDKLMQLVLDLKDQIAIIDLIDKKINQQKKDLDAKIHSVKSLISNLCKEEITYSSDSKNVVTKKYVTKFEYKDESEIINYLKKACNGNCVNQKLVENLDKVKFKKLYKNASSEQMRQDLAKYVNTNKVESITVTTASNYDAMLKHINENETK